VRRLFNPVQGGSQTAFDLLKHPSLAQYLVAWLEDIQG
jgi:hypothetical protein